MQTKTLTHVRAMFGVLLLAVLIAGTASAQKNDALVRAGQDSIYVKIEINGMACPFCAYGLEKKIRKVDGSSDYYVDINKGYITFNVPRDKKPTEIFLKKLVKEAGFEARKITYSSVPIKRDGKENNGNQNPN